jgi:hypothetical protein
MSYVNKYTEVNQKTPVKNIGYAFLQSGFHLKLYHGITLGVCDCKAGSTCPTPGKHPLFGGLGRTASVKSLDAALLRKPNSGMGVITGYYPKLNKQLVIVDLDNKTQELLDETAKLLPSILNPTFTEETKNGYHFWFWAPAGSYIKTAIRVINGLDILSSNTRGCLTIGSADKVLLDNSPIATLTPEECKRLHKLTESGATKVPTSDKTAASTKVSKKFTPEELLNAGTLVDSFYNGTTQHGQYNSTIFFIASRKLRSSYSSFKNDVDGFVDWVCTTVSKKLPDANMAQVEQVARSVFNKFDINKCRSQTAIFDEVFKNNSAEVQDALADIFEYGFHVNGSIQSGEREDNCVWCSLKSLRASVYAHLEALGINETVYFTEKQFVIFLSQYHAGMQKKTIDTKAFRGRVWNLSTVSHHDMLQSINKESLEREKITVCGAPIPSINDTINTSTIEEDITNDLSPDELWRQEMQAKLTATERHYTAPAQEANSWDDKVSDLREYFDC